MLVDISLPLGLELRVMQLQDQAFAEILFFSTRNYLYQMPIPKDQLDILIRQQYLMQQASYAGSFPSAETFIVELYSKPIGKIVLNNNKANLHIIDIALIDSIRGKGFGRALLRAFKAYAVQQGQILRLAVDQQNTRAKKLYLELGFTVVESSTTHDTLRWS